MPSFRQYDVPAETEVDVDIDIDVDEFLDECDEDEIKEAIEYLKDKGYLKGLTIVNADNVSVTELEFMNAANKLATRWNLLSKEEENFILNIAKRF